MVESLSTLKNWHHSFRCPGASANGPPRILRMTCGAGGAWERGCQSKYILCWKGSRLSNVSPSSGSGVLIRLVCWQSISQTRLNCHYLYITDVLVLTFSNMHWYGNLFLQNMKCRKQCLGRFRFSTMWNLYEDKRRPLAGVNTEKLSALLDYIQYTNNSTDVFFSYLFYLYWSYSLFSSC